MESIPTYWEEAEKIMTIDGIAKFKRDYAVLGTEYVEIEITQKEIKLSINYIGFFECLQFSGNLPMFYDGVYRYASARIEELKALVPDAESLIIEALNKGIRMCLNYDLPDNGVERH